MFEPGSLFTAGRDAAARAAMRAGYRVMRCIWRFYRPNDETVGVLIYHEGRVLAVRHSYRPGYTIPGGRIDRGETPAIAAARELREELSIEAAPEVLVYLRKLRNRHLMELVLSSPPGIRIDNREIVEAVFLTPQEAMVRNPTLRRVLERG